MVTASASMPSSTTFKIDEIQKWITEVKDDPLPQQFKSVKQKIIQEVQTLGLTNGELFWTHCHLRTIEHKLCHQAWPLGPHQSLSRDWESLSNEIRTIFIWAHKKKEVVSKLPPIDFETLNLIKKDLEALRNNSELIDDVKEKTLVALKEKSCCLLSQK